jgi:hypothetical protein
VWAWIALCGKDSAKIATADEYADGGCDCCQGQTEALAVYPNLKTAKRYAGWYAKHYPQNGHRIVKCVIMYEKPD